MTDLDEVRYKEPGPPYEHICQDCGRTQEVYEYGADPKLELGEISSTDEQTMADVLVHPRIFFECPACKNRVTFDSERIETGITAVADVDLDGVSLRDASRLLREYAKDEVDPTEHV